jgi:hypothetical protein
VQSAAQVTLQMPSLQWGAEGLQLPQMPPQLSPPHSFPLQIGRQWQALLMQPSPSGQSPQVPPQPSSPQALPAQLGVHEMAQAKFTQ